MKRRIRELLMLWGLLVLLGAVALAGSFLPLPRNARLLLVLPCLAMVALIACGFMDLRRGGMLSQIFAMAALFWLCVLLGLGAMDPMTRQVYPAGITVPG